MDKSIGKLTVYFDDPFWVGVFEHIEDEKLSVCKITFGAEPKDSVGGTDPPIVPITELLKSLSRN